MTVSLERARVNEFWLYLEDAPAGSATPATGLSKALLPMLRELAPRAAGLLVVQTHRWMAPAEMAPLNAARSAVASIGHFRLSRLIARLPFPIAKYAALLHGALLALRFLPLRRRSGRQLVLWSAIGVDPLSLFRLRGCAWLAGAAYEAYFVDDIERHPSNVGALRLGAGLTRAIRGARRVYAITPELGARLNEGHGVMAVELPLTAECPPKGKFLPNRPLHFATYLGSVNHLYVDGLRLLIKIVGCLRQTTQQDLSIRIVAPMADVARIIDPVPPWVECGVAADQDIMAASLANASCCFLPYSHAISARYMVTTSFPSKLLDYLAWARHIVIYAPPGSVPINLFRRCGLEFATCSEVELRQELERLARSVSDHGDAYRAVLADLHGPGRATAVVFGGDHLK